MPQTVPQQPLGRQPAQPGSGCKSRSTEHVPSLPEECCPASNPCITIEKKNNSSSHLTYITFDKRAQILTPEQELELCLKIHLTEFKRLYHVFRSTVEAHIFVGSKFRCF